MNKDLEKHLTIIIITKDRYDFINRLLAYYNFTELKSKILIADSTDFDHHNLNSNYIENYKNLDINFYHRPNIKPENLQNEMLEKVRTKYTIVCADDDIIIDNSIIKCVDFLEKNNDYIAVTGRIHGFATEKDRARDCKISIWNEYNQQNISETNPNIRLKNYLSSYWVNFFSIVRTDDYIRCSKYAHLSTSAAMRGEIIPCMTKALLGKTKKLNHLHMLRQFFLQKKHYPLKSVLEHAITNNDWSKEISILKTNLRQSLKENKLDRYEEKFNKSFELSMYYYIKNEVLIFNKKFIFDYLFSKIFTKGKIKALLNIVVKFYQRLKKLSKGKFNETESFNNFKNDTNFKNFVNFLGFIKS
ncbi:MAG: TIGR00180 family glycosyltransferase [Pelagibacteraceae bacterium]|nr:TIGR00180 family glycosyltransferase [Pelagibacteraceae bacterium]MCI5078822.1 TIGR00180 family glycosyltransferase [Pelagibacteraceae bacterium]